MEGHDAPQVVASAGSPPPRQTPRSPYAGQPAYPTDNKPPRPISALPEKGREPGVAMQPESPDAPRGWRRRSPILLAAIVGVVVFLVCTVIAASVGPTVSKSVCDNRIADLMSATPTSKSAPPAAAASTAGPSSSSTSTACPPSAVTTTPSRDVAIPSTGCEDSSTFVSTFTTTQGQTFQKGCDHNAGGNDIVGSITDSWDLCMESCTVYNNYINASNSGARQCVGVAFVPSWIVTEWAVGNISFPSNCFLKHTVPAFGDAPNQSNFEIVLSKLLPGTKSK